LKRNIYLGSLRGDYRLPSDQLKENAQIGAVKTKNYWITMGLIARQTQGARTESLDQNC
jgi:hypothetical protein